MPSAYIIGLCWLSSAFTAWAAHNSAAARAIQALYRPFSRRGKLHHARSVRPPCTVLAAPRGQGSTVAVIFSPETPPIFRRKFEKFFSVDFFSDFSPVIVDSRWHFLKIIVAVKVAERIPRKSLDLRGHFHSRYSRGSKSLGYFASSASMILSASAPYTSSRYFRRSSSGSLGSPRGFSGRRTTSCWSV